MALMGVGPLDSCEGDAAKGDVVVDWAKKITKVVGGDIQADEQVEAGVFVQPSGMTAGMMGQQLGGIVGSLVANKMSGNKQDARELVTDEGIAATFPKGKPLVLGITGRRFLAWGHSKLSGKPKGLQTEMPLGRVAAIEMKPGKLAHSMVLVFDDGTGVFFEAAKVGKPDHFKETFERLRG